MEPTAAAPPGAPSRVPRKSRRLPALAAYLLLALSAVAAVVGAAEEAVEYLIAGAALYLVAAAVAHIIARSADATLASHGRYIVWTFWVGFVGGVGGEALTMTDIGAIVGVPMQLFLTLWMLWRYASGLVRLLLGRAIDNVLPLGL